MLLFVDNIFRFTQAGAEVSALLGRIPSAVGYQPTLATDMGGLQERITTTTKGSSTSVQAIYVPADDLTDPAPATAFTHLDATTVLSRGIAEKKQESKAFWMAKVFLLGGLALAQHVAEDRSDDGGVKRREAVEQLAGGALGVGG